METILVWFRRDLRLADNPALHAAKHAHIIPIYIHAPDEERPWQAGAASNWWLHHSLVALATQLAARGSRLIIRRGESLAVLQQLIKETDADAVLVNRLYEPAALARDQEIKRTLTAQGIRYQSFASALLFEPWEVKTAGGTPYKVFTPFWHACQKLGLPSHLTPAVRTLPTVPRQLKSLAIEELQLLPAIPWDAQFYPHWQPGQTAAHQQLKRFLKQKLTAYATGRDVPAQAATSRLSPHLHFGEITPRQIAYAVEHATHTTRTRALQQQAQAFLREIVWREFTHYILYHFPATTHKPLNPRFEQFPWHTRKTRLLRAWQRSQTGFPIIDAGMRELWQTGSMHNRVRMLVGSLLTKNLGQHWLSGAKWFWDTLVDADLAQNSFNWQWIAGCGADAAPYFRIFNPVMQSEKFDPRGEYIRRWLPELAQLPDKFIHAPWLAPAQVLQAGKLRLGKDYPLPICDLKLTREEALLAYKQHTRSN